MRVPVRSPRATRPRRRRSAPTGVPAVLIGLLVTALVAGCTSSTETTAGPEERMAAFIADWQTFDGDAAAALTDNPPAAALVLDTVTGNLGADSLTITPGAVDRQGDTATATVTMNWTVDDDTWTYPVSWTWRHTGGGADGWDLVWTPTVVHPKLGERQTIAARATSAEPGVLVDRTGTQLVSPTRVYSVVVVPAQTPDLAATAAALAPVLAPFDPTITPDSIVAGVQAATAEASSGAAPSSAAPPAGPSSPVPSSPAPSSGADGGADGTPRPVQYTVINLRENDYQQVKAQLDGIPGLVFPSQQRNLPPTRDFARTTLASVNEAVAGRIKGTSGWTVFTVDATGGALETLYDQPAVAGQRVQLTLDTRLQQTAEQVLAGVTEPAVLLTMQPSTGEILTIAQNPAADALGSIGLTGRYPPGSTFKTVTLTAGLNSGLLAPDKSVPCPGTWTVDGRLIRNHNEFDLGNTTTTQAFANSCNTTFAQVASQLPADALPATAAQYGIGLDFVVDGITTLTGSVPTPDSTIQKAEDGFGQGQVTVTPFSGLLMAATAQHGTMPMPTLIRGTTTTVDRQPTVRSPQVQQDVRDLMAAVVRSGTGAALQDLPDVHIKTGTAEFVADDGATHAHAWTVGYQGDLAFAAMIVGGEDSLRTNILVHDFLAAAGGLST